MLHFRWNQAWLDVSIAVGATVGVVGVKKECGIAAGSFVQLQPHSKRPAVAPTTGAILVASYQLQTIL